jgi:D-sedoheptulose 7-phosphate isomerase
MEDYLWLKKYFEKILNNLHNKYIIQQIHQVGQMVLNIKQNKKKIFFFGNGSSNVIATHASLDYTSQLNIKCYSMNDPSQITAFANDFGFENFMKRYLQFYSNKGDLVVLISSSGESLNIINAGLYARRMGCDLITFTGFDIDNTLKKMGKVNLWVDSRQYNIIEGIHNLWITTICDFIAKDLKIGMHGHEFKE